MVEYRQDGLKTRRNINTAKNRKGGTGMVEHGHG